MEAGDTVDDAGPLKAILAIHERFQYILGGFRYSLCYAFSTHFSRFKHFQTQRSGSKYSMLWKCPQVKLGSTTESFSSRLFLKLTPKKFSLRFFMPFAILPMIDFGIAWLDGFRSHFSGIVALSLSQMNPNKRV